MRIRPLEEVWTSDDYKLGVARAVYARPEDQVNPDEKLYAAYLEVENFDLGDGFFVPMIFLQDAGDESAALKLTVPMKQVMNRTWSRTPEFIARGGGMKIALPYDSATEEVPEPQ